MRMDRKTHRLTLNKGKRGEVFLLYLHVSNLRDATRVAAMPRPYLAVATDRCGATLTAVGEQILVALGAVLCVFFHYVLLSQQGVFAVMAVETLAGGHGRLLFSAGDRRQEEEQTMKRGENSRG